MEREGVVSLWLGNTSISEFLNDYVEIKYTEDGDCEPSKFLRNFKIDIDDIEEDFIEKVRYEDINNHIENLLLGCSYEDVIIPKIKNIIGSSVEQDVNTVILVYNLEYSNGNIKGVRVHFATQAKKMLEM
ncbi:immunity 22 family protein [Paraclostridium ghonii]|uniref:immunity 22 family protein n=1 Tax=Paraclostridium ghonii TaxID=29358 RepID=UPI00202CFD4F|nr:immunity 22 family protein [Paeniclostridium ghonii]MCM0165911.1 immunity 22 family protein [Paeniclostridium ghonii]